MIIFFFLKISGYTPYNRKLVFYVLGPFFFQVQIFHVVMSLRKNSIGKGHCKGVCKHIAVLKKLIEIKMLSLIVALNTLNQ